MIDNGFLVEDDCDELLLLEQESQLERNTETTLSLTIAPTLACNFGCDYCFEQHSAVHMSKGIERALLAFAKRHVEQAQVIQITWFGGEPTLCLSVIERLQAAFADLANLSGISLEPSSIITNGYLLDKSMATRLKAAGVAMAQVTLDGPREIHDIRRPLRNGRGSFDRIMANIEQSCKILSIVLRVNVDKDNIEASIQVVEDLRDRGILQNVNVHFAQVTASGEACASIRDRCFTDQEFSEQQASLYQKLFHRDIFMVDYPQAFSGGHCGAVSEGSFVVSPTGDLFKCWEELSLDTERSIGNVLDSAQTTHQENVATNYRTWDPFRLKECRDCNILPICMGGCPIQGMQNGNPDKGACSAYKYSLEDMLYLRYLINSRKEVIQ